MSRPDPWRISHQTVAEATDSKSIFAQRQGFADSPVTETTWQSAAGRAPLTQNNQVREMQVREMQYSKQPDFRNDSLR
tara:strand:- start:392 stop:625 length:234 start_codon:yes stop_codon:yes gene_type:complete